MLMAFEGIMAAAILVRLNRGIPTVDWKSVDIEHTKELLNRLESAAKDYVALIFLIFLSIIILLFLLFSKNYVYQNQEFIEKIISTVFGFLFGLLLSRMGYVVWLDLDIVRLQKAVLISSAEAEDGKKQTLTANEKIDKMNTNRLKK